MMKLKQTYTVTGNRKPVLLAGNGISARILKCTLEHESEYYVAGVVGDNKQAGQCSDLADLPFFNVESRTIDEDTPVFMAVGYSGLNMRRAEFFNRLCSNGWNIESYISSRAIVLTEGIGKGCLIMPSSVIEPGAVVGADTVVWGGAYISHDSIIGSHCWLASGCVTGGSAKIGNHTFLGINSSVVNDISVGAYNFIGTAASVTKNTGDRDLVLGPKSIRPAWDAVEFARSIGF